MSNFTIKSIAACALIAGGSASFAQHSGHSQVNSPPASTATPASPYAGEQSRDIKSLSASDVKSLQTGAGMSYAKAAELNGFPGPAHVLEHASALKLSSDQRFATQNLMDQHKAKARVLGEQLVESERALDVAFASKQIDPQRIEELTTAIGALQARLRTEHLQTHLKQTALLESQQVFAYQKLRGYTD